MSRQPSAFLEAIIASLMPFFSAAADLQDARSEIIETLAAYATRSRSELLQAAQIIALGMTTLDVLAEARAADTSPATRTRHRACAGRLNRAALSTQQALRHSLAQPGPTQQEPLPQPPPARAETSTHAARRDPEAAERHRQLWAGAMVDTLNRMGLPIGAPPVR